MNENYGRRKYSEIIGLMDVLSIFLITYYHAYNYYRYYATVEDPFNQHIMFYMVTFGLTAFAFSSGYKLFFNHEYELGDKKFLTNYLKKRIGRLYFPYISYLSFTLIFVYIFFNIFSFQILREIYPFLGFPPMDIGSIIKILTLGIFPLAGHLWFLFVILIITMIVLVVLYLSNGKVLFFVIFPALFFYFTLNIHYMQSYEILTEIPYYVALYAIIFLFGSYIAHLQESNEILFDAIVLILSVSFILSLCIIEFFPSIFSFLLNTYLKQILINPFFLWGMTYPLFLLLIFNILYKFNLLPIRLARIKIYTLIIYIFQYPFIIPISAWVCSKFALLNGDPLIKLIPFIVTLLTFILCIAIHFSMKQLRINRLFE